MLNKILIPAALIATVIVAGIFAFMPVEKASTVHGTLATSSSITTLTTTTTGQDRAFSFTLNMSRTADSGVHTLIPASSTRALSGSFILSAQANNATGGTHAAKEKFSCGVIKIGTLGVLTVNATDDWTAGGSKSSNGTFTSAKGLAVQYDRSNSNTGGLCRGTIFIDSGTE